MKISTSTHDIVSKLGLRNTIELLKNAGFDCFDIALYSAVPEIEELYTASNYLELAKSIRFWADEIGIACNQTHAPTPSSRGDARDTEIFQAMVRSLEISAIWGAKIIVIHPQHHLNYADHQRELFRMNVDFFTQLVPYAEKYDIKMAVENICQNNTGSHLPSDSVCSRTWEFNELIDTVDSPYLVGCLDIGHASLVGADIPKFIHNMGAQRLQALHIHDTNFVDDCHTLPFLEKIDYHAVAQALGEIGYCGDFTFEVPSFFAKFPAQLQLPVARMVYETGKHLANLSENVKY